MKAGKLAVLLTAAVMMIFAGTGVSASSAPQNMITVNYDFNGGKNKLSGVDHYSVEYPADKSVSIEYPSNVENGDLVFLGWKKAEEYDDPKAEIYCEAGVYGDFIYRYSSCSGLKDGATFKALWGKPVTLTLISDKDHKFRTYEDHEYKYVEKLELTWFNELSYEFRFSMMVPFGERIYDKDGLSESDYWISQNVYSSDKRDYALTAFKSTKTGKVYDLHDYKFTPTEDESFEAIWTKTVKIDEDFNGGELPVYGTNKELDTDYVPAGRTYYAYYYHPQVHFDMVIRDDQYIVKPGYKLAGWKNSSDGKIYKQNDPFVPTEDIVFSAVWEKIDEGKDEAAKTFGLNTVRYDANGGEFKDTFNGRLLSNEDKSLRAFYGNLLISAYETDSNKGGRSVKDVKLPVGYFVGDSRLFYEKSAQYDESKYKSYDEFEKEFKAKLPVKEVFVVEKEGFVLEGWTIKGDTTGKVYKTGDIFTLPDKDVTFEAKWAEPTPTETPAPTETPVPTAVPTEVPGVTISVTPTVDPDNKYVGDVNYIITSRKKKTVTYRLLFKSGKSVTVPATVKIDNVKYKVTRIQDLAFKGNKKITKIVIGKNVTTIDKEAFSGCTKLKTITVKSKVLKKVGKDAFKGVSKKAKLILPQKKQKKLFKKSAFKGKYVFKK